MKNINAAYEKTRTIMDLPINIHKFRFSKEQTRYRPRHWHRSLEIAYHENADGKIYLDGKERQLKGNVLVLINSECVHEIHNYVTEQSTSTVLIIPYAFLKKEIAEYDSLYFFADEHDETLIRIIKDMMEIFETRKPYYSMKVSSLLYELIYYLCSHCIKYKDNLSGLEAPAQKAWSQEVIQYLDLYYNHIRSTDEVSRYFNYSRESFSRKFKQVFQCTLHQYLTKLRVYHALKLLWNTDSNYSHIAEACGFPNVRNMKKNMLAITGNSPDQIRGLPEDDYWKLLETTFF